MRPPRIFISVDLPAPFPNQCNDLTGANTEAYLIERDNSRESFADPLHLKDWVACVTVLIMSGP